MSRFKTIPPTFRLGLGLAIIAGIVCVVVSLALAEDSNAKPAKKLDGAALYAINCNRCHSERYPTEHTKSEWKTIMLEMRVRAGLPANQAKAILKYLEENAGQ
jgi:cytochrome c5